MTPRTGAVVDAHLARLDAEARRAFVADLWGARGFETNVDDTVVAASRGADSLVVYPLPPHRLGRPARPDRPVDVVVAFDAVPSWTASDDVRVVTPAGLREMLRHALDPADAAAVCRRHLGAPPESLDPPLPLRVRDAVAALSGVEESVGVTTVVALLAVVVLVVAASGALFADEADPVLGAESVGSGASGAVVTADPTQTPSSTPTPTSTPESDDPPVGSLDTVPGVGPDGVTNLTALAVAHDRRLGTNYTLWTDRYRPRDGVPGAPRTQRDTDMAVKGDRYLVEETFETGDERRLARVVYFDGTDWFVDERGTETASVRWVDGDAGDVAPNPHRLRRSLVTRFLATPTTDVTERVYVGRDTRYRLEGTGRPPSFPDHVYNYSFVAIVGEHGLVHEAAVEFTVVTVEGSYRLRFEWTYGALGETTVAEPAWLHLAHPPSETTETRNRTTTAAS